MPLQLFRSITIFFSQNVIVVYNLTEVVTYFVYSDNWIVKKKLKKEKKISKFFFKLSFFINEDAKKEI